MLRMRASCLWSLVTCCTCGIGPRAWDGLMTKIGYHRWPLKIQMTTGIMSATLFVLAVLAAIIQVLAEVYLSSQSEAIMKMYAEQITKTFIS